MIDPAEIVDGDSQGGAEALDVSTHRERRCVEQVRDEKIFRRKTADERQRTKKCQRKKCQTKNGHGIVCVDVWDVAVYKK